MQCAYALILILIYTITFYRVEEQCMVSLILILQKRASTIIYTQVIEDKKLTLCTNYRAETKLLCNCCWMRHDLFLLIMLKFVFFLQSMLERDQFIYNNLYKGYMFVTSLCIHIVVQASFELRFICAIYKTVKLSEFVQM